MKDWHCLIKIPLIGEVQIGLCTCLSSISEIKGWMGVSYHCCSDGFISSEKVSCEVLEHQIVARRALVRSGTTHPKCIDWRSLITAPLPNVVPLLITLKSVIWTSCQPESQVALRNRIQQPFYWLIWKCIPSTLPAFCSLQRNVSKWLARRYLK